MHIKHLVVGGGTAGLHYASKAKSTVLEEHHKVGQPIACTGLVTDEIFKFYSQKEINKITLNKLNHTTIITPNNKLVTEMHPNYILCNKSLTELSRKHAEENNSTILTGFHYLNNSHNKAKVIDRNTGKELIITFDKLIGADGPHSKVAKTNSLAADRNFVVGVQTVRKHKMDQSIHFYPHISEYAWAVPENKNGNTVRLGLCTRSYTAKPEFDEFSLLYPGKDIGNISGIIPLHKPRQKLSNGFVSVIGDAALQTKNTTGGGIIAGFKAAEAAASGNYKKNNRSLNRELYLHYLVNRAFLKYTDNDWDKLAAKFSQGSLKQLLEEEHRDNFVGLAIKAFLRKPNVALAAMPLLR